MAGHDRKKQVRSASVGRRLLVGMGAGAGVFFAAAAMATGSTVTAAPAKADFDALIDPIIQPILTSLTDSIAGFDPALATDLTSWSDSFLASLNSIDLAFPAASEPAAVAASSTSAASGTYDIPITMQEVTEPTVQATVDGTSNTLLVDTGSSGLVIPWEDLGSNDFTALENLFALGSPIHSGFSGYSGGVEYFYLTYDAPVDYGAGAGALDTTNTPVDVEIFSYPTSLSSPANFEQFVADNGSTGILGIGDGVGPATESPLQAAGFSGVTLDIPAKELVIGANAGTPLATISDASSGAPITGLTESVNGGTPVAVSDDVDSGGVYGTIPQSLAPSLSLGAFLPQGDKVSVYDGSTLLYSYTVGTDSLGNSTAPFVVSGTNIDSGVIPYLQEPIYIDYTNDSLTFDK